MQNGIVKTDKDTGKGSSLPHSQVHGPNGKQRERVDLDHDCHEGDVQQNFNETWKTRLELSITSTPFQVKQVLSKVKQHRFQIWHFSPLKVQQATAFLCHNPFSDQRVVGSIPELIPLLMSSLQVSVNATLKTRSACGCRVVTRLEL